MKLSREYWEKNKHLLGSDIDRVVAQKLGVSVTAVANQRAKRGIPPIPTTAIILEEVEKCDADIEKAADRLGIQVDAIVRVIERWARAKKPTGISPVGRRIRLPERWAKKLGKMPDKELAKAAGCNLYTVTEERRKRGIGNYRKNRSSR